MRFFVANRTEDDEFVARAGGGVPQVACDERDFRNMPLRPPARSDDACKFRVVRDNQDAGLTQETPTPLLKAGVFPLLRSWREAASC